jgi:hypothetical protein
MCQEMQAIYDQESLMPQKWWSIERHMSSSLDMSIQKATAMRNREYDYNACLEDLANVTFEKPIVIALESAANHAKEVAERPHILADRIERVNIFITSLRKEFSFLRNGGQYPGCEIVRSTFVTYLVKRLCQKSAWIDIGVLAENNLENALLKVAKIWVSKISAHCKNSTGLVFRDMLYQQQQNTLREFVQAAGTEMKTYSLPVNFPKPVRSDTEVIEESLRNLESICKETEAVVAYETSVNRDCDGVLNKIIHFLGE